MSCTEKIIARTIRLKDEVKGLKFSFDGYVYNPLEYAWEMHRLYLERYVTGEVKAMFLGMNPGPFGMMQTGIPFGEIDAVKNYLCLEAVIDRPEREHPARPVDGMSIKRHEISGKRLWGLIREHFPDVHDFFSEYAVFNYCPLGFLDAGLTAKNITPDKLPKSECKLLEGICDDYLKDAVDILNPDYLVGVGKYAEQKLKQLTENTDSRRKVISVIHPSPGNPQANNGWAEKTLKKLTENGLWI
ncbi:MAG: single-stranded DNA-binding protein [Sphaerochaetaceae bacterium]|nr:single-stranded DNA-binding protein [Sphaerochaetaceae bacterium]